MATLGRPLSSIHHSPFLASVSDESLTTPEGVSEKEKEAGAGAGAGTAALWVR